MKKILLTILLGAPIFLMAQQPVIQLTPTTGSESSYALSSIAKHTYVDGKLVTTFSDGTTQVETTLATLSKVTFGTTPTGLQQSQGTATNYTLYPMPVSHTLNIGFDAKTVGKAQLCILTLDGRTVLSSTQSIHSGANQLKLYTANLQSGIYICHLTHGNETYTQQIIKQ